jgi:CheY-like chemotaxis protein
VGKFRIEANMNGSRASRNGTSATRRILLIGQELSAGEATERYLEYYGHTVTLAGDPASAMSRADDLEPEVLICDLNPASDDDRARTAQEILKKHPSDLVIITSYSCGEVRNRFPELEVALCLRKPISLESLARAVAASG